MSQSDDELKNQLKKLDAKVKAENRQTEKENPPNSAEAVVEPTEKPSLVYLLFGFALFCAGVFMVFQNTIVYSGFTLGNLLGFTPPFGIVLLPLLIGIGMLFYNEKSPAAWVVSGFGLMIIILGIIMGLRISFMPMTLFQAVLIFAMIFGGVGMMARFLRLAGKN